MKQYEENLIEHAYDGIQEFDNPMPLWLTLIFVGTIFFSVGYLAWYHVFDKGMLPLEAYKAEMIVVAKQRAARRAQAAEADLYALLSDAAALAEGGQIFATNCAPCHAADGSGLIGPNLKDATWIHGTGTVTDIAQVVANGVLDKGMPAWEGVIGLEKVQRVAAWVANLR